MSGRGGGVWRNSDGQQHVNNYNDNQAGPSDYADYAGTQRSKKIKIVLIVVVLGALIAGGLWAAGYLGAEKKEKEPDVVIAPARSVKKANGTKAALKRPVAKPAALSAAITTKPDGRPVTQKPAGVADKSKKKSAKANKNRKKAKKDDA